jgi:hypothetical protein
MRKLIPEILTFLFLMAGIFFACDQNLDESDVNSTLTVDDARAWYTGHKPEKITLKSGSTETRIKYIQPDWNRSVFSENEKEEVIETDILCNGVFGFMTREMQQEWAKTGDRKYNVPQTRLVTVRSKAAGKKQCFFMTVSGEKNYLEKKNFLTEQNTYHKKDDDFSGFVLFHNLDGSYSNGWKYENGKVTAAVSFNQYTSLDISLKSAPVCHNEYIYYWETVCTNYYYMTSTTPDGVIQNWQYNGSSCMDIYTYGGSVTVCSGISGTDGGGSYTGTGSSDTQPQAQVLCDRLKQLFSNVSTSITATAIDNLNNAYQSMNYDCMLNSISNYLASNNIKLGTVSIDPNQRPQAKFDGVTGNLTFGGDWAISTENLSHEWFHIGQKKMNSVNLTDGYAEFEAWLFFDIKETIRVGGNFDSSNHNFACYKNYEANQPYKTEYQSWLMIITNNGTTFPASLTSDFYNFGPKFAETREYSLSFGNTSYNTKTMFDLFNNCK